VFEIEPTIYSLWDSKETQIKNFKSYEVYPEITDRKLLEMICIFSQHCNFGRWNKYAMHSIDDFEYIMLSQLIEYQKKRYTYGIKEKIQQLFKEAE
jgi:hypothetical protein